MGSQLSPLAACQVPSSERHTLPHCAAAAGGGWVRQGVGEALRGSDSAPSCAWPVKRISAHMCGPTTSQERVACPLQAACLYSTTPLTLYRFGLKRTEPPPVVRSWTLRQQ